MSIIEHETLATLTTTEAVRRVELEGTIRAGLQTFYAVGNALAEIRESRLYRSTHASFEEYARATWGMSKSHANRLIGAAEVVAALPPELPPPATESQARELAAIADVGERAQVWGAVVESGERPTAAAIKRETEALARQVDDLALFEALARAYSADRISSGVIAKPAEWDGKLWTGTGGMLDGGGGTGYQRGQRLIPLAEWEGPTYTYAEKSARYAAQGASAGAFGYTGIQVHHGKQHYVIGAEKVTAHKPKQAAPDQPALIDLVAVLDRYAAIGWLLEGERAPWTARTNRSDLDTSRVELRSWAEVESTIDAWEEQDRQRAGNLQWYGGSVPPPPAPSPKAAPKDAPPLPALPNGWQWEQEDAGRGRTRYRATKGSWITNWYQAASDVVDEAREIQDSQEDGAMSTHSPEPETVELAATGTTTSRRAETDLDDELHTQLVAAGWQWEGARRVGGNWHHRLTNYGGSPSSVRLLRSRLVELVRDATAPIGATPEAEILTVALSPLAWSNVRARARAGEDAISTINRLLEGL